MIISKHHYNKVRKSINAGENRYKVVGKTGTAARYTDTPNTYYYVIDDCDKQVTLHYPVDGVSARMQRKFDKMLKGGM